MSAQETVALQEASTFVLMASMTSNPRTELALGPAPFSPVKVDVSSRRMEPSQPWRHSTKKKKNQSSKTSARARTFSANS